MKNALRDSTAGRKKVLEGFLVANGSVGLQEGRRCVTGFGTLSQARSHGDSI